jgi:hypothetical protein
MVEISLSGSGEGPGRVTGRGYSTIPEIGDFHQWEVGFEASEASNGMTGVRFDGGSRWAKRRDIHRDAPPQAAAALRTQDGASYAASCSSTMGRC